jgi:hypothetical protein
MYVPISSWFAAFALTLVVEVPLVLAMLRREEPNLARLAVLVVFVNLATHLVVWYVATQLLRVGTVEYVVAAEAWAILAEAVFYVAAIRGLTFARSVVVAAAANLASFVVGRLLEGI